ncbi:zinc finger and BTB domain-containing protein 38 [Paramormyrops kingsleyae]|uniref:Zinc finger and BTB domain containing 38 n=1 Tax=Paramormyrops kingsleyae TaxID=1676925 RepID=A0A3B3T2F4_9TELE|nr:zinc finger and BTB domain-containing protein 38-like [Paramormyrops kingsleyae]
MTVVSANTKGLMDSVHAHAILSSLNEQRTSGLFCDVTIVVEDIKFKAHRNVLAASSGYFRSTFSTPEPGSLSQVLELVDLRSEVFASILNFIYSSKVAPTGVEDTRLLVAAGKRLGIPFLENMVEHEKRGPGVPSCQTQQPIKTVSPSNTPTSISPQLLKNETARAEEVESASGPRITNAFSITEAGAPLGLRGEGRRPVEPGLLLTQNSTPAFCEPVHNLSEHSYAVSQGGEKEAVAPSLALPKSQIYQSSGPLKKRHRPATLALGTPVLASSDCQISTAAMATTAASTLTSTSSDTNDQVSSTTELPVSEPASARVTSPPCPSLLSSRCDSFPETPSSRATPSRHSQIPKKRFARHLFCKFCCRKFMHLKRLRTHEQVCNKAQTTETECDLRGTEDGDRSSAGDERSTPEREISLQPSLCSNDLSTPKGLTEEPQEVDGRTRKVKDKRVYTCGVCKRAYVTLSSLRRHENVHSWHRAYPCHYCDKVFALAEYRTKHEVWHTGERRYQCIFCLDTFMTYYILKNHQKSYHGIDPRMVVNRKSANGSLKGSIYPIKLYRLLPMTFRKRRYTYSQTFPEESPNKTFSLGCSSPTVSFDETGTNVCSSDSLFNMPVTFMATPKVIASVTPHITFDQPCDQDVVQPLSSEGVPSLRPRPSVSSMKEVCTNFTYDDNSGPSVIRYGCMPSLASNPANKVSSVIRQGNDNSPAALKTFQNDKPFLDQSHDRSLNLENPLEALTGAPHHTEAMANYLLGRDQRKTETYIAKPACPGPSEDSRVLPLCQITVKIGEEALVRRRIRGSKLFSRRRKKSHCQVDKEDLNNNLERSGHCPDLRLRTEVASLAETEAYDDATDHDTADQLWRPYYSYKPKKKPKKLRCKRRRSHSRQLGRHVKEDMKVLEPNTRGGCVDMGYSLNDTISSDKAETRSQLKNSGDKMTYTCDTCNAMFFTLSSLQTHVISCRPCFCRVCGKLCTSRDSFDGPEEDKDLVCKSCVENGSCFENTTRAVSTEKRYRCAFCPQRFLYLATKRSHEKKHIEKHSKGYSCYYCPKICKTTIALSIHQKRHLIKAEVGDGYSKSPPRTTCPIPGVKRAPKQEAWELNVDSSVALKLEEQERVNSNDCYQEVKQAQEKMLRSFRDSSVLPCPAEEATTKDRVKEVGPENLKSQAFDYERDLKDGLSYSKKSIITPMGTDHTARLQFLCKEELSFHHDPVIWPKDPSRNGPLG